MMTGSKECVFVGGGYGVGKTSLCAAYAKSFGVGHYVASDLIRRARDVDKGLYKEVVDARGNQDVLLAAMRRDVTHSRFILDGHFVIKVAGGGLARIPLDTYRGINPLAILVVTADSMEAASRLRLRDGKDWSVTEIEEIQSAEMEHGNYVANMLNIDLHVVSASDPALFSEKMTELWPS